MQKAAGNPVSPSSLFEMSEDVMDASYPVFSMLCSLAAAGKQISYDDTGCKILSHLRGLEGKNRTTHTTGLVAKDENGRIIKLFFSDERSGGKTIDELLKARAPDAKIIILMRDALAANNTDHENKVDAKCLVHARRPFWLFRDIFPEECKVFLDHISRIYLHEKICRTKKLSDSGRLEIHSKHSLPLMIAMRQEAKRLLDNNLVEHNTELGKALKYLDRHWDGLSKFCSVEGCPLDNNISERLMKSCIRHRKNSLFYKTDMGALVGDVVMSVGFTALEYGVDPHAYFTALQKNISDVHKNPDCWLPWNYATRQHAQEPQSILAA